MPQDVKLSPDGRTWYIADMQNSGVWILHGDVFANPTFLPTGAGAHGLYVSRDSKSLYITNRGEGSISVLDFATGALTAKWRIPGGGSPDMGGLSADGTVLWVSGRYNNVVYAISTSHRQASAHHPSRDRTPWPVRLATTGPLLPGPHRNSALTSVRVNRPATPGERGCGVPVNAGASGHGFADGCAVCRALSASISPSGWRAVAGGLPGRDVVPSGGRQ